MVGNEDEIDENSDNAIVNGGRRGLRSDPCGQKGKTDNEDG